MKSIYAKCGAGLLLLLGSIHQSIQANEYESGYSRDGCCFRSYECSCNPLYCGAWDLQVQAGVAPIKWRHLAAGSLVDCSFAAPLFELPLGSFKSLFRTPWVVGGQIGYHWSENSRVYFEFNYVQAKSKSFAPPALTAGQSFFCIGDMGKYKVFDAYIGARYYTNRCWCDRVAFFIGGQVGLAHHTGSRADLVAQIFGGAVTTLITDANISVSNTVVSGGANFGFDVCICGNWSFVVTGEVLASCGPRFNNNLIIPVNTVTSATNILGGSIGTELRFPITAGIRYSF